MHVAIDLTNSPHVPFFAPLVRLLEADGHRVAIFARRFAQTVELARLYGLDVEVLGAHGGASRWGKARAAAGRSVAVTRAMRRHMRRHGRFDVALSHGSTDLPVASRLLGVPHVTIFDYEWAVAQHRTNCRLSWRVVTPDSIPRQRLDQYGARSKLVQYPGLKEEYYLDPARIDEKIRSDLGVADDALLAVLRPPPELALYHRGRHNDVFDAVIGRLVDEPGARCVVLARTPEQRAALAERYRGVEAVLLPEHAVDGASLVANADLVVSAGGTMNREAVALGVPVYTVFAGRLGGVDEQLVADGRLRTLARAEDVALNRRDPSTRRRFPHLREARDLLELVLADLPERPNRRRRGAAVLRAE